MRSFETNSEEETIDLGRKIARELPQKSVVLLIGNLGAGKTTLAKGILSELGVAKADDVTSPTFTLIHEYSPRDNSRRVYHIDLYRLETRQQVATLGLEEILDRESVVLVEWGERFPDLFPAGRIEIRLQALSDSARQITINQ